MHNSLAVYRVNGRVVVAPLVRTTSGLALEVDPCTLGASPDREAVEAALRSALAQSGRIVPHPARDEWKGSFDPFLKAADVRSFTAFMATAQRLDVDEAAGALVVTPNRNLGAKEGFEPVHTDRLTLPDLNAAARAVLELLPQTKRRLST